MLVAVYPVVTAGQAPGVLHVRVHLPDRDGVITPVARHAVLISDDPVTAPPRRAVTGLEGTVDVRLRPGRYVVESDGPVVVADTAYQWTVVVDVAPGGEVTLALNAANAEVTTTPMPPAGAVADAGEATTISRLPRWKNSVVSVWTPTSRLTGFLVEPRGLVATSLQAIGTASIVEVQLSPTMKVEGRVVHADAPHGVAVVAVAAALPAPAEAPRCEVPSTPALDGQEIVALGRAWNGSVETFWGRIARRSGATTADFRVTTATPGSPVLTEDGTLVGMAMAGPDARGDAVIAPVADVCAAVAAADAVRTTAAPSLVARPVESVRPFPPAALRAAYDRHGTNLRPYRTSASSFDLAFITPLMVFAARQPNPRTSSEDLRTDDPDRLRLPAWSDFANWSEYVSTVPPVLLVRITPKLEEGFWTTVARGAAMTQGVALPPLKRFKAQFGSLRVRCGEVEVEPIHRFRLDSSVVSGDTVVEGLYALDPDAIGPHCGNVRVTLTTAAEPDRPDTRQVDMAIARQIWEDFAPYRARSE